MNALPSSRAAENAARAARSRANALHDAALVRRFRAGDVTAFDEIVLRHREALGRATLGLLRNWADAEEVVQDTFVRAYRALASFRGDASLHSWLHCIALNLARNRYWYFFRRHRHLTESYDRPLGPEGRVTLADLVPSDAPSPVREATSHEFSRLVTECMGKLAPLHREALELRNVHRQAYEQIAVTLGITTGTVKSRIARAREKLRALMLEAYATPTRRSAATGSPWFETARSPGRINGAGL